MRLLLIDTASAGGSVALADTTRQSPIVASEMLPGRSSSERLIPAVRRLLATEGWKLRELAAMVVVHGPGSFTGVRVGVSAAKGFSEAAAVPLIAVSRLALLAAQLSPEPGCGEQVHAVLDAGRNEFYYGEYAGRRCLREALLNCEEVQAVAVLGPVIVCEARVAEALVALGPRLVGELSAADALPFAIERIAAAQFDDAASLDANYLRRTDVELFARPAPSRPSAPAISRPPDSPDV